jgi:hypothetical protein
VTREAVFGVGAKSVVDFSSIEASSSGVEEPVYLPSSILEEHE